MSFKVVSNVVSTLETNIEGFLWNSSYVYYSGIHSFVKTPLWKREFVLIKVSTMGKNYFYSVSKWENFKKVKRTIGTLSKKLQFLIISSDDIKSISDYFYYKNVLTNVLELSINLFQ